MVANAFVALEAYIYYTTGGHPTHPCRLCIFDPAFEIVEDYWRQLFWGGSLRNDGHLAMLLYTHDRPLPHPASPIPSVLPTHVDPNIKNPDGRSGSQLEREFVRGKMCVADE
ncbi:uncharacterized protein LOC62_06G008136 [Vanrija pseudolonga]|uniref:Uncharacterized protein n=1 Tax=Vanrija pseudolonga TaxID=143232 RepID=A0AAF0YEZ5_9TREE|nr:hypothetical protein LOC62_06G008136 [Vanrija pseudolonga]